MFWEVEQDQGPATCSPSSSLADNPPPETQMRSRELQMEELSGDSPDQSLVIPHNDTAIVCALSAPADAPHLMDTSIGSTTLLDTFEGLSHDDIITFTLVDITPGFEPVNDRGGSVQSSRSPTTSGTPDSSAQPPTASTFPRVEENSCGEATRVTGEAVQDSSRCEGTQRGEEADLAKIDPVFLPPASSERLIVSVDQSMARNPTQGSPVSSSDHLSLAMTQKVTQEMPSSFENRRWSFLLSKNPQFSNKKPEEGVAPVPLHVHSTPNPVQRPQGPGRPAPRVQLKMEDGSLPLKAAAMYHSFGIKGSVTPNAAPLLSSTPSFPPPVTPNHQTASPNTTSPPSLEARDHMEMLPSRRGGSRSQNGPPCLNHTEALRYKLIKKLKAKKKKLAKLNEILAYQGPDSTDLTSPSSVSSSTHGGSLLLDLLSPATTASNLSPDSTSFLDMMATGQEGATQLASGGGAASHLNKTEPSIENFLDDFISQVASQRPTEMETEALSALDLFL